VLDSCGRRWCGACLPAQEEGDGECQWVWSSRFRCGRLGLDRFKGEARDVEKKKERPEDCFW
jgi:hypothetical protein